MTSWHIGQLRVDRVEEFCGPTIAPQDFLAGLPEDALERNLSWLSNGCYDAASGLLVTSVHSWIVRTRHHNILIDACCGNGKSRPTMPPAHQLNIPWLERLADKGLTPEMIDYVMCTHLHADHVGWNTRLENGRWVPTFPNARYIFSRVEYEHWHPEMGAATGWGQEGVFQDSVLPCVDAGLVTLVESDFALDDEIRLEGAPGHTKGNVIVRAESSGVGGLFTGDCMHTPLQVAYPDVNSVACEDQPLARATRRRLLSEAAERGHFLFPAHFPPPFVGRVTTENGTFRYHPVGSTER